MTRHDGGIDGSSGANGSTSSPTAPISIVIAPDQEALMLRIGGELDIATIGGCRAALNEALATVTRRRVDPRTMAAQPTTAVLDLSELTFLAAAGLRMVSDIARALADHGISTVLVVRPGGLVSRLVDLAGLDRSTTVVEAPDHSGAAR